MNDFLPQSMRITNYFENGQFDPNYGYWEDLGDNRGKTAGFFGAVQFDTDENGKLILGDLFDVFNRYEELENHRDSESWTRWVTDKAHFEKLARTSHNFRQAQIDVNRELYGLPALGYVSKFKLKKPVATVIVYDILVQHGNGKDKDGFAALVERSKLDKPGDEHQRLNSLLAWRRLDLMNPANKGTTKVWRQSVKRVDALSLLLKDFPNLTGNYEEVIAKAF